MGNSESVPNDDVHVDRRSLYEQRSLVSLVEESDDDPLSSGDDWDHNMKVVPSSDENIAPNQEFMPPSLGLKRATTPSSPTRRISPQRVARRDPEEDPYFDEMDHDSRDGSSDEGYDDIESDADDDDADTATSALMDASAAVFHYLTTGGGGSGYTTSEDGSIADRSAAVFEYLKEQASYGNEKPIRQFLQTAQAVSQVLRNDAPAKSLPERRHAGPSPPAARYDETRKMQTRTTRVNRNMYEDEVSVSQQSAAIFHALERAVENENEDDDEVASIHSDHHSATFPQWLETRSDPDAQSVVSEISTTIFKVLDETKKKVDSESVAEFSAAVSTLLESQALGKKTRRKNDDDQCSISERSAAIFKVLDRTQAPDVSGPRHKAIPSPSENPERQLPSTTRPTSPRKTDQNLVSFLSHLKPKTDPAKLMQRNIFHILAQRAKTPTIPTIKEEVENEEVDERDDQRAAVDDKEQPRMRNPMQAAVMKEYQSNESGTRDIINTPTVPSQQPELPTVQSLMDEETSSDDDDEYTEPVNMFSEVIHADSSDQEAQEQHDIQQDIDLNFVEHFDGAFNHFMGLYPKFLLNNPNLVHHLRITKLQKLLEYMDTCENDLLKEIDAVNDEKQKMIIEYQYELKEASRRKAACQIKLQNELGALTQRIQMKQAQLMWKIVNSSEIRAKKEYMFRQHQKKLADDFVRGSISSIPTREEILGLIPEDDDGTTLENAIFAAPRFMSKGNDEADQIRQFQVDNAFMASEISVLQKKLMHSQAQWKRLSWVETVLLRIDNVQMAKLKKKFAHKLGVTSFD